MALEQRGTQAVGSGECRECLTFCDKLIEPRACAEMGCRFLYSYTSTFDGTTYVGCLRKVFKAEVDLDAFDAIERGRRRAGIKMTGKPLPHCPFRVEPAVEGDGAKHNCVNPKFFDCTDAGVEGVRVFDLRDVLH